MKRVKGFQNDDWYQLANQIDGWLKKNTTNAELVDIQYVVDKNSYYEYKAMVVYEEIKKGASN